MATLAEKPPKKEKVTKKESAPKKEKSKSPRELFLECAIRQLTISVSDLDFKQLAKDINSPSPDNTRRRWNVLYKEIRESTAAGDNAEEEEGIAGPSKTTTAKKGAPAGKKRKITHDEDGDDGGEEDVAMLSGAGGEGIDNDGDGEEEISASAKETMPKKGRKMTKVVKKKSNGESAGDQAEVSDEGDANKENFKLVKKPRAPRKKKVVEPAAPVLEEVDDEAEV